MPSRKRNQGKQRKAKAASAATATATSASSEASQLSEQDDKLAQLINNLSLKKCNHGRPTLADEGACKLFMMEFERSLVLSDDVMTNFRSLFANVGEAFQSAADHSCILSNHNDMEKARACLLALGADFLLKAVHITHVGTLEQAAMVTEQASAVAVAIVLCENSSDTRQLLETNLDVVPDQVRVANPAVMQKIGDLFGGNLRETVSFFAKRLDCSCLKDLYKQVKGGKKTAFCCHCHQTKERKSLMLCSECKIAQYCSAKCQKENWPKHKNHCKAFCDGMTPLTMVHCFGV